MKTVKAFTLIELIVVFAIIGVLVAILVPSMMGYVSDSKLSTANSNAKLTYTNTAAYCTKCETSGKPMQDGTYNRISLTYASEPPAYDTDGTPAEMQKALQNMMGTKSRSAGLSSVLIDGSLVRKSAWAKTEYDVYVGCYPGEAKAAGEASIDL